MNPNARKPVEVGDRINKLESCPRIGYYDHQVGTCQNFDWNIFLAGGGMVYPRCKGRLDCVECDVENIKKWEILKGHWGG